MQPGGPVCGLAALVVGIGKDESTACYNHTYDSTPHGKRQWSSCESTLVSSGGPAFASRAGLRQLCCL